jgi:hypothetical protein
MHPELTAALAAEHRRDLTASAAARSTVAHTTAGRRPRTLLPHYKLTWSRTTLAQAAADRGSRSWVIVISATRAL